MARASSTYGDRRCAYRTSVVKPEGRRPLERPRRNWRIILKWSFEIGMGDIDWIDLVQDRDRWRALVNAVINLRVP